MAYTAWSVVFGEQPTAAKWNQLGENDAGFRDGTNIDDDAIVARHIDDGAIESEKNALTIACKAYRSSAFTINGSAKVTCNAEVFDVGNDFNTATGTFVAPVSGYYKVSGQVGTSGVGVNNRFSAMIYVNGSVVAIGTSYGNTGGGTPTAHTSALVFVTAGQSIELYTESSASMGGGTGAERTFIEIQYMGS